MSATTSIAPREDAGGEVERGAFNAAFYELGLRWYWDSNTFAELSASADDRERVQRYMEREQAHMLRAYDAAFLTEAILTTKQRCRESMAACAPHAVPRFNWADPRWGETGF
ncbi:MAG: hypothetical protein WA210_19180 [Burkholderiaceae bacterium]